MHIIYEEHDGLVQFDIRESTIQEMKRLQHDLCVANHVYCSCIQKDRGVVTNYFGDDKEQEALYIYVKRQEVEELLNQFRDYDVENVIDYASECPFLAMTGIAIRDEDKKLLGFGILFGFIQEKVPQDVFLPQCLHTISEEDYIHTVAFLECLSKYYFHEKLKSLSLEADLSGAKIAEERLEELLNKNAVFTEILKMLESENDFSKISEDILRETAEFLKIDNACLFQMTTDNDAADMIGEWTTCDAPLMSQFQKREKSELPFLTGRPYTISTGTVLPDDFAEFFEKEKIRAGVFLPLLINGKAGMYLAFLMQMEERKWGVEELKFLHDVRRVMQTVLVKRITKNSLASSYNALEAILENAGCGILVEDIVNRKVLFANETFHKMFDDDKDKKALYELLRRTSTETLQLHEYHAKCKNHWFDISFAFTNWVDGRNVRLATIYDITNAKNYERQIEQQVNTDFLTGLYNRKRCLEDIGFQIKQAIQTGKSGACLYIDLDDFKNINDTLGHREGDELLKLIAERLQRIAGESNICYRVGGDEFVIVIVPENFVNLQMICDSIKGLFNSSWQLADKTYYCTMSMSVVVFPKDGTEPEILQQRSDIAMTYAKQSGKNRIEYYSEGINSGTARRLELEKSLREAVMNHCEDFKVYYQPIVDVTKPDCPCCGAEALLRWESRDLGFMNPMEFIPLAEYLGLIVPIGEYVLREACFACKYWNDLGHPEYKINVNLSVVQLLQKDVVAMVKRALNDSGMNPTNLTLEVTEGLAINDMEAMKKILGEIKALGVRIALDDFGTGYSSLNHIRSTPLDVIKIDKCFIDGIGQDVYSDEFVKTISHLAEAIDVNVCVEGVEDEDQLHALNDMRIDMIQGYLFDKPLPRDVFEAKYLI